MKPTRAARAVAIALCAALATGCTLLTPVKNDMASYVLNRIPADLTRQADHPDTLLVLMPEADPLYATRRMAYSTQAFQVGYFNESEWALAPAGMIQPLLVETLRRTGHFGEIASAPQPGRHTFTLRSELLELKQDFSSEPATFRVTMRFSLLREPDRRPVATRELSVSESMRERTAYAGVVAGNEAIEKLLRAFAAFALSNAN